jgi:hypothetical protein
MNMDLLKHLAWRKHDQILLCDSRGATMIGSSVGGGHETSGASAWFYLSFTLMQFKVFPMNAITIKLCLM